MAGTAAIGARPSDGSGKRAAGRYVLGDLLGRGGMAEVFSGHSLGDHGFQKPVAIKRLLPELASDHVFVERLIEEAKLLVGMQHGNIVSVIDLARDGDDVFLVMEFVDGPSLRQLLKSRGSRGLSVGVATYIAQSAAAGLEFAHNRPGGAIIHADISPSNLLLTTSGEVRVADFGIARREGGGHGVVEGKWAYMAPEQARGEPLTPRSDVFALGVVLYELLTGAHPFGRQVTHEQRDNEPMRVIPPRVVKPSIPHGLDAICMRALAHDPRDRYKSMQQLIDAIVEERFSNHLREAASDLAGAIRDGVPNAFTSNPRTMVTDRPVTIMTRSLLREITPPRRPSPPKLPPPSEYSQSRDAWDGRERDGRDSRSGRDRDRDSRGRMHDRRSESYSEGRSQSQSELQSQSQSHVEEYSRSYSRSVGVPQDTDSLAPTIDPDVPPIVESGARTSMMFVDDIARVMADVPAVFRADGTPLPSFRMPESALLPAGQDLAGVVGGHTMTSHQVAADPVRASRGTLAILVIAALIGICMALAFQLRSDDGPAPARTETVPVAPIAQPVVQPTAPVVADDAQPTLPTLPTLPAGGETAQSVTDGKSADGAIAATTADGKDAQSVTDSKTTDSKTTDGKTTDDKTAGDKITDGKITDGKTTTGKTRETPRPPVRTEITTGNRATPSGARTSPKKDAGFLRVHTTPWSWATVAGEKQDTPWAKFKLAPGRYTVRLSFPTLGTTETHQVTIEPQKTFTLNIDKGED